MRFGRECLSSGFFAFQKRCKPQETPPKTGFTNLIANPVSDNRQSLHCILIHVKRSAGMVKFLAPNSSRHSRFSTEFDVSSRWSKSKPFCYELAIAPFFIAPGSPWENRSVESFNATLRRKGRNVHWFESLPEAQVRIEAWRREYNESRPYRALQDRTPAEFARQATENPFSTRAITAGHSP